MTLQHRSTFGCKPSQLPLIPHGRTSAQSADGGKEKVPHGDASKKKGSRSKPKKGKDEDGSEKESSKIKLKKKELLEITTVGVPTSFNIPVGTTLVTFTVRGGAPVVASMSLQSNIHLMAAEPAMLWPLSLYQKLDHLVPDSKRRIW